MLNIIKWIKCNHISKGLVPICIFLLSFNLLSFSSVTHSSELPALQGVGGNFSAISSEGTPFQLSELKGKVVILGFGYTNCADVCPLTLGYLKTYYQSLSKSEQDDVQVLFVTVDPDYDSPEHLRGFLNHFHQDFIGLTGTREQVDNIVALYKASYNPLSGYDVDTSKIRNVHQKERNANREDRGKLYNHSIALYVLDREGSVRSLAFTGTPIKELAATTRQLLSDGPSLSLTLGSHREVEHNIATHHFRVALPAKVSKVTAAYGVLHNESEESDILLSASSVVAEKVEVHLSMASEGSVSMYPLDQVVIPANGSVTFKPGDLHLMVMGLKEHLQPNQEVPIVLHFSKAGDITVNAKVMEESALNHHH